MAADDGEKSQDPTPHRRREMRERGQVAQSHDLTSAAVLLGGLTVLVFTGTALLEYLVGFLVGNLSGQAWMSTLGAGRGRRERHGRQPVADAGRRIGQGVAARAGIDTSVGGRREHVANRLSVHAQPRAARLVAGQSDGGAGADRLRSRHGAAGLRTGQGRRDCRGCRRESVCAARGDSFRQRRWSLPEIAAFAWDVCLWTCVKIGFALVALAVVDYGFERWKLERDARMTPQEVREEQRTMQGDPQIGRAAPRGSARDGRTGAVRGRDRRRRGYRVARGTDRGAALSSGIDGGAHRGPPRDRARAACEFAVWRKRAACRSSRKSSLRPHCTSKSRSAKRFPRSCSRRWPKCWPTRAS